MYLNKLYNINFYPRTILDIDFNFYLSMINYLNILFN